MSGRRTFIPGAIILAVIGIGFTIHQIQKNRTRTFSTIVGTVIRDDPDPHKQLPVPGVRISSINGLTTPAEADSTGHFQLNLNPSLEPSTPVSLQFQHSQYETLNESRPAGDQLWIVRMKPRQPIVNGSTERKIVEIADVRIRHTTKAMSTANVGSVVRTLDVVNQGNIPCEKPGTCSPDGKWKAALETFRLDAGENRVFRNLRLSCIAGPCPFTKIETEETQNRGQTIHVVVRNWSDTTTFLIEAEVFQTMMSDMVRRSYPAIFGTTMNFTLPSQAMGPSIEAELDHAPIVFPLGPNLILSWAVCSVKTDKDQSRLYRCELKPGYQFKNTAAESE